MSHLVAARLQIWEGATFPHQATRPVVNLFHSRLVITCDWFRTCDAAELMQTVGNEAPASECKVSLSLFLSGLLIFAFRLFSVVLKRSLTPCDHDSFTRYVSQVYLKQQQELSAQQQNSGPTTPGQFVDNRVGLNIEHLLR